MRQLPFALLALLILFSGCNLQSPQRQLERAVAKEKKNLPTRLDEVTTLVDIEAGDLEIIYIHEINDLPDSMVLAVRSEIESSVRSNLQTEVGTLKAFADAKIKMTYAYRNSAGTEIHRFSIEPWNL